MRSTMEFKNHKITEAVCAFRFTPSENTVWDSTFLGEYYNRIKETGFEKKQEITPFKLDFQINPNEGIKDSKVSHGESQMVFKTTDEKYAILMGNSYISFHSLNHYPGWNVFLPEVIEKNITTYFGLGLGKGIASAQMIFINNFEIEAGRNLSDYLVFVPEMENFGQGDEISHLFQSTYSIKPNKQLTLRTIFNILPPGNVKKVTLESNCIANNSEQNLTWKVLVTDAHDNARNAFVKVASEYFKNIIK